MRQTKIVQAGEHEIVVRELTVAQVRQILDQLENYRPHLIDLLFNSSLPACALPFACDMSLEEIENKVGNPADLHSILEAAKEVNPFLVVMLERLRVAATLPASTVSSVT